jgi:hypothetical protein
MKKYKLDFKYIKNKQSAALAVMECLYDAVVTKGNKNKYFEDSDMTVEQLFFSAVSDLKRIMFMDVRPIDTISGEFASGTVYSSACFREFPEKINKIMDLMTEAVVIDFDGYMPPDADIMTFVPDFPEWKVMLNIINNTVHTDDYQKKGEITHELH